MSISKFDNEEEINNYATNLIKKAEEGNLDEIEESKNTLEKITDTVYFESIECAKDLNVPVKMFYENEEKGNVIGDSLLKLRDEIDKLNPEKYNLSDSKGGIFSFIGMSIKKYLQKYNKAQDVINAIVDSLENGKGILTRDNSVLQDDQKSMKKSIIEVKKMLDTLKQMDSAIENEINKIVVREEVDEFIKKEILYMIRQKTQDLGQQLLIAQQAVLSTDIIIQNNKELIRSVNQTINVTVNALNIAVSLSLSLNNQEKILKQVDYVNKTTSDLIKLNSEKLKNQGIEIQKKASSTRLDMQSLKEAFDNIYSAMNDIEKYKIESLTQMKETIIQLDEMSQKGDEFIRKMDRTNLKVQ